MSVMSYDPSQDPEEWNEVVFLTKFLLLMVGFIALTAICAMPRY